MRKVTTAEGLRIYAGSRADGDVPEEAFRAQFADILAHCPPGLIAGHSFHAIPASQPPWLDSGIVCAPGEQLSVFVAGRVWMSRELDIWLHPHLWLWFRIGEQGDVFRGQRCSHSFTAEQAGTLYLGGSFPGEWTSPTGDLASHDAYAMGEGGVVALVVRWQADPLEGLRALAGIGDVGGLIACEIDRLETEVVLPDGWAYPWNVGTAEAFAVQEGFPVGTPIGCFTKDEVISLNTALELDFKPGTRLAWSWKMDRLPSACREDFLHTHDYIAVAVYFDNGRDLAYYWSAELPPETAYQCPIPKWTDLETHVAIRSGAKGLGEWFAEERDVHADYVRWIGEPPATITGVWLIALSVFRHGEGQAEIADIRFLTEAGEVRVS